MSGAKSFKKRRKKKEGEKEGKERGATMPHESTLFSKEKDGKEKSQRA